MDDDARRLAELERLWEEKFSRQPRLPTSALLTTALSMALAFGGVLFLLSPRLRVYAWFFFAPSVIAGILRGILARRWYQRVVVPWDAERRAAAREMEALRAGHRVHDT